MNAKVYEFKRVCVSSQDHFAVAADGGGGGSKVDTGDDGVIQDIDQLLRNLFSSFSFFVFFFYFLFIFFLC